jgi:tRNA(Ile)-lysidine synthase
MRNFRGHILKTIEQYHLLDPGDHIIVAISGGPDSVALAAVLLELRRMFELKLTFAHLHHGLRPTEADEDLEFVRALAKTWEVPIEVGYARLGTRKKKTGSLEEIARERRYAFLESVRKKHRARRIALGHQANDVAETLIINLVRGSVLTGLSGIPPVQGNLIRPLIHCTRQQILEYLQNKNLAFRTDSSNADLRFLRNRIRHQLMPQLSQYNPAIVSTLLRTAQSFHELDRFLHDLARDTFTSMTKSKKNGIEISIPKFKTLPQALRQMVLREAIREQKGDLRRISQKHVLAVDTMACGPKPNASLSLPGSLKIKRSYQRLSFSDPSSVAVLQPVAAEGTSAEQALRKTGEHSAKTTKPSSVLLKIPGKTRIFFPGLGPAIINVSALSNPQRKILSSGRTKKSAELKDLLQDQVAFLDQDLLPENLCLRPFQPGDRLQPLGMPGHRKVKDIFMDMKIPTEMRPGFPVLAFGRDIVWVPGFRIADPYKITPDTKMALKLSLRFHS